MLQILGEFPPLTILQKSWDMLNDLGKKWARYFYIFKITNDHHGQGAQDVELNGVLRSQFNNYNQIWSIYLHRFCSNRQCYCYICIVDQPYLLDANFSSHKLFE